MQAGNYLPNRDVLVFNIDRALCSTDSGTILIEDRLFTGGYIERFPPCCGCSVRIAAAVYGSLYLDECVAMLDWNPGRKRQVDLAFAPPASIRRATLACLIPALHKVV